MSASSSRNGVPLKSEHHTQRSGCQKLHVRLTEYCITECNTVLVCRIGCNCVIKVADFGLSTDTYEKLYFRQDKSENTKLPIKWLAIECMEDAIFSEKSDVVSQKLSYLIYFRLISILDVVGIWCDMLGDIQWW